MSAAKHCRSLALLLCLVMAPAASLRAAGDEAPDAAPDAADRAAAPSVADPAAAPSAASPEVAEALAPPVRVDGAWTGIVFEGGARFTVRWQLTQHANTIRGSVTENRVGGSGYGKYAVGGNVTPQGVTYQARNWDSRRPAGWCLPAGSLVYSRDEENEYLAGQLRPNSTAGGCSAHRPTAKRNLVSRGDTGRIQADCRNNNSAGACPRFGRGTIRLERPLR